MRLFAAALVAAAMTVAGGSARAEDTVTIGAIYPLTGAAAHLGGDAKAALETAAEIVDKPHQGLEALPLGAGAGLSRLGGAKVAVAVGDDLGNPSVAQSQVLRLIGQDSAVALIGSYQDTPTLAAAMAAERRGVPFLVPGATAPAITGRGFKSVFRTAPLAIDIARTYAEFLAGLKAGGAKVDAIALVAGNAEFGTAAVAALGEALRATGFTNVAQIGYPPNASDLSPSLSQLRDLNPDVAIVIGQADEAILLAKTMKTLDYKPPLLLGDDAGFTTAAFVAQVGNLAQGVIERSAWSPGKPESPAAIVNRVYKAKSGHDLDDASARIVQGFLVLADAINRAGSTDPAAIQKALRETDLQAGQLITGDTGVKFDAAGQNALASTYLVQLQGKEFVAVWPAGDRAGKLALPFRGWE
jgi:branched-chain amino acid transport system substrate-binding protein